MIQIEEKCKKHDRVDWRNGEPYCYECEKDDFFEFIENEWKGLEKCITCNRFDSVYCSKYPNMTSEMFGRKKKCKHHKQILPCQKLDSGDDF